MLLQRAKTQSERFITSRRVQEESINKLATKLKQESHEKHFANWEIKGQTVFKKQFINNRMSQLREIAQEQIQQRRDRLNDMLQRENEAYKQEIEGMEETPAQVRERMLKRVAQLKQMKEEERRKYVEQQLEKKFENEADELRKVDADFKELKTTYERNIQMMEKQRDMEEKFNEEMIYADLYMRDIKQKEKQEQEILKQQRQKIEERNKILGIQKDQLEDKYRQEKHLDQIEKEMLNREWKTEAERIKKQKEEQFHFNRQLNRDLITHNMDEKKLKEVEHMKEKHQDKEWIQQVISREKALDKLEEEMRERQKKETRDFLLNFKNRTNELNNDENELNRLIEEENERQWKKRMDVWQKEEDQRVKLMYDVYGSRAQDIDEKKKYKTIEVVEKEKEKEVVTKDLEEFKRDEERAAYELWLKNKDHQKNIIQQKEEKIDRKVVDLQKLQMEREEEKLREKQYQEKIAAKKYKGKELLDELRKMRPF